MNKPETAAQCFKNGYACSQAVFSTFSPELGLNKEQALKIGSAFGGGIARSGNMCGAVTGAFMAIGLKYVQTDVNDEEAKEKCQSVVKEFIIQFRKSHNSLMCHELLGFSKDDPEGLKKAKEAGLTKSKCPYFVESAARILEAVI